MSVFMWTVGGGHNFVIGLAFGGVDFFSLFFEFFLFFLFLFASLQELVGGLFGGE